MNLKTKATCVNNTYFSKSVTKYKGTLVMHIINVLISRDYSICSCVYKLLAYRVNAYRMNELFANA